MKISFFRLPQRLLNGKGKLVGAGIGALAGDPSQAVSNIAGSHALCQIGNTLSVAGAAADKFQVVNITVHQIKGDFLRANALRRPCAICAIGPHNPVIHIAADILQHNVLLPVVVLQLAGVHFYLCQSQYLVYQFCLNCVENLICDLLAMPLNYRLR